MLSVIELKAAVSISAHHFCARQLEKLLPQFFKFANPIWRTLEETRMAVNERILAEKESTTDEMRRKTGTVSTREYSCP